MWSTIFIIAKFVQTSIYLINQNCLKISNIFINLLDTSCDIFRVKNAKTTFNPQFYSQ